MSVLPELITIKNKDLFFSFPAPTLRFSKKGVSSAHQEILNIIFYFLLMEILASTELNFERR